MAFKTILKSDLRKPSIRYAAMVKPMTTSGCENSFVLDGISLPTNGTANSFRDKGTDACVHSSKFFTSCDVSKPNVTRLILDKM